MKESETYEISFPDIEPKVWDLMMKFVSDPLTIRDMTVKDVMLIATAYDQYDFATGLQCCDRVLFEYFQKVCKTRGKPLELEFLIDALLLADKAHLEEAKQKGIEYFKYVLDSDNYYGRCMFGESRMKRLAQLIAGEKLLLCNDEDDWTKEEILSPLFPKLFVRTMSLHLARSQLDSAVPAIKLSALPFNINEDFFFYKKNAE